MSHKSSLRYQPPRFMLYVAISLVASVLIVGIVLTASLPGPLPSAAPPALADLFWRISFGSSDEVR